MPYADYVPQYRRHKPSGQAVVSLNGKDHYLGAHGSAASRAEYNRLVGEWLAAGRQAPASTALTISEMLLSYKAHVEAYYRRPDGRHTSEVHCIRHALKPLRKLYGSTPAIEFGPLKLIALREAMIGLGCSLSEITGIQVDGLLEPRLVVNVEQVDEPLGVALGDRADFIRLRSDDETPFRKTGRRFRSVALGPGRVRLF